MNDGRNEIRFIVSLPQLKLCTLVEFKSKSELYMVTVKNGA